MPFTPWCGDKFWEASPKIFYVGKSVGIRNDPDVRRLDLSLAQWKRQLGMPDPRTIINQYVTANVASLRPASPAFWLLPLMMTNALVPEISEAHEFVNHIAWSNLYKTCRNVGNGVPTKKQMMQGCSDGFRLRDQCASWLIDEIRILKPNIVLLGIGKQWRYFAEHISALNRHAEEKPPFRIPDDTVKELKLGYEPECVWLTYHFSAWTTAPSDQNRVNFEWSHGDVIADLIRRRSMRQGIRKIAKAASMP